MLNDDTLEVRILGYKGRTIHKDKCSINNPKKLANLFWALKIKFDIDPEILLRKLKNKDWFNS